MDDFTGSDDIYVKLGPRKIRIGTFVNGQTILYGRDEPVPVGVNTLSVFEEDTLEDDLIGNISLNVDMDQPRTVPIQNADGAKYVVELFVGSTSSR